MLEERDWAGHGPQRGGSAIEEEEEEEEEETLCGPKTALSLLKVMICFFYPLIFSSLHPHLQQLAVMY